MGIALGPVVSLLSTKSYRAVKPPVRPAVFRLRRAVVEEPRLVAPNTMLPFAPKRLRRVLPPTSRLLRCSCPLFGWAELRRSEPRRCACSCAYAARRACMSAPSLVKRTSLARWRGLICSQDRRDSRADSRVVRPCGCPGDAGVIGGSPYERPGRKPTRCGRTTSGPPMPPPLIP